MNCPEKIEFTNEPPKPEDIPDFRMRGFARWLIREYEKRAILPQIQNKEDANAHA